MCSRRRRSKRTFKEITIYQSHNELGVRDRLKMENTNHLFCHIIIYLLMMAVVMAFFPLFLCPDMTILPRLLYVVSGVAFASSHCLVFRFVLGSLKD